jgi:tetratricopeptide (TPR) repeat protein
MQRLLKLNRFITFLLCICFALLVKAQTQKTFDSLVVTYGQTVQDSVKCFLLNKLSWLSTRKADYKNTVAYADSALKIARKLNNKNKIADCQLNLSEGYYNLGNYDQSAGTGLEALKRFEELKLPAREAIALTLLGGIFFEQDKLDESLKYFFLALEKYKAVNNTNGISYCYNNISLVYSFQKKPMEAIKTMEESIQLKIKNGEDDMLGSSYTNLGLMYLEVGQKKKGVELYNKALAIYKKIGNDAGLALVYLNFGGYYLEEKNYQAAKCYYDTTLQLAKKTNYLEYQKSAYGGFSKVYQKEGKYKEALDFYIRYTDIKDTLLNAENTKNVSELQTRYETDKKEKENQLLQTQNQLSKETIKQQRTTSYFIVTGLVLALLLAIFIFRGLRQQRTANKIISEQKNLVEEKQKEILDSIHYARRIQQSLLPTEKYMERKLNKEKS